MMRSLRWLFIFALTMCFIPLRAQAQMELMEFEEPLINEQAPEFSLATLKGKETALSEMRDGKNTILFFWATWCPHCRSQLKELSARKSEIEAKGIKVVLVDAGEAADTVQRYMDKNKIDYDVFLDENSEVSDQYSIVGVPTFVFIDQAGVVKNVDHSLPDDYTSVFAQK